MSRFRVANSQVITSPAFTLKCTTCEDFDLRRHKKLEFYVTIKLRELEKRRLKEIEMHEWWGRNKLKAEKRETLSTTKT